MPPEPLASGTAAEETSAAVTDSVVLTPAAVIVTLLLAFGTAEVELVTRVEADKPLAELSKETVKLEPPASEEDGINVADVVVKPRVYVKVDELTV